MKFSSEHQPKQNIGRPKGSRNAKGQFSNKMTATALDKLQQALDDGNFHAIQLVLSRTHPAYKAATDPESIDGKYLELRSLEISEFDKRIAALEAKFNE